MRCLLWIAACLMLGGAWIAEASSPAQPVDFVHKLRARLSMGDAEISDLSSRIVWAKPSPAELVVWLLDADGSVMGRHLTFGASVHEVEKLPPKGLPKLKALSISGRQILAVNEQGAVYSWPAFDGEPMAEGKAAPRALGGKIDKGGLYLNRGACFTALVTKQLMPALWAFLESPSAYPWGVAVAHDGRVYLVAPALVPANTPDDDEGLDA